MIHTGDSATTPLPDSFSPADKCPGDLYGKVHNVVLYLSKSHKVESTESAFVVD